MVVSKLTCLALWATVALGEPTITEIDGDDGLITYGIHHRPGQVRWYHWNKGQVLWALLGLACLLGALTFCCTRTNRLDQERPVVYVQPAPATGAVRTTTVPVANVATGRTDVVNYA
ncbi:putative transmembrane protein [Gregarina niphandrodes]|uniref:Transmembrane protein n=1 Tax=Gregarina niphandrodes TaxID=110365 RepID=A0A023B806_GRENI|nr:putative transmembrane protein [Gregarina niphandrodes]EZG68177.1 putative transmembrane protein [Gregarina niphandrodes]|eukprot:XP_011130071.1 putative transmembrane protein [Gregarina niphandrodes]